MVDRMDVALVAAARAGDQRALDALVSEYLPLVYNIVGRALAQRVDVDDVVQDTMLRVVRGLGGLRDPERFRSWLVAVTVNQVREHRQSRYAVPTPLEETADLADPGADFVELTLTQLGLSGQRREVAQATCWLDADDRDLLALWWLEAAGHLSRTELVNALQLNPHHVTVRIARMKGQLETARLIVRALAMAPTCPQLAEVGAAWPGQPTPLWRKRFARHIRECGYCPDTTAEFIPAERLLAGLSLIPLPGGYELYIHSGLSAATHTALPGQMPGHISEQGAGHTGSQAPSQVNRRITSHRAGSRGLRQFPAQLATKPLLGIGAIAAIGVIALAAIYLPSPHSSPVAAPPLTSTTTPSAISTQPVTLPPATVTAAPTTTVAIAPTTTAPAPVKTTKPPTTLSGSQSAADQVLALINQTRAQAGLPPYTFSSGLMTSAGAHNQTMADGCGLSHQCPGEPALGDRETAAGVQWTSAGENIGEGGPVSDTTSSIAQMAVGLTQDMINEKPPDDGHRLNILSSSFHHIGIVVSRDSSGTVWMTQDFSN